MAFVFHEVEHGTDMPANRHLRQWDGKNAPRIHQMDESAGRKGTNLPYLQAENKRCRSAT